MENREKKKYVAPEVKEVMFQVTDIIVTSGGHQHEVVTNGNSGGQP